MRQSGHSHYYVENMLFMVHVGSIKNKIVVNCTKYGTLFLKLMVSRLAMARITYISQLGHQYHEYVIN